MKIAHASDTHDHPVLVKGVGQTDADVILLTGDILSNRGRLPFIRGGWSGDGDSPSYRIDPAAERKYQRNWFRKIAKKWAPAFGDRPVVYVPGNHDFIDIREWLTHYGCKPENIHVISKESPSCTVFGKTFAGFRDIPWISGEWMGENSGSFMWCVDRAFDCDPDILVTHAPPNGILDGHDGYGIQELTAALAYRPHKITHHFFGHEHSCGGRSVEEMGVTFVNGACHMIVHEVP